MTRWTRDHVAALVDHTLLKPEATEADVRAPRRRRRPTSGCTRCACRRRWCSAARGRRTRASTIATVVGFPSGKHLSAIKAQEAALAVEAGADEVDMVIDVGAAIAGDFDAVRADIAAVRAAVPDAVLKVIVESAALLEPRRRADAGRRVPGRRRGGRRLRQDLDRISPAGGASVRAVEIMAATVGPTVGVKASGGIRTAADAVAMLDAGATRLGLSGTRAVLDGLFG